MREVKLQMAKVLEYITKTYTANNLYSTCDDDTATTKRTNLEMLTNNELIPVKSIKLVFNIQLTFFCSLKI